jgi:hypothetical protein
MPRGVLQSWRNVGLVAGQSEAMVLCGLLAIQKIRGLGQWERRTACLTSYVQEASLRPIHCYSEE